MLASSATMFIVGVTSACWILPQWVCEQILPKCADVRGHKTELNHQINKENLNRFLSQAATSDSTALLHHRQFGNLLYLLHLPCWSTNASIHQQRNKHSPSVASLSARGRIGFCSCVWFYLLTPGGDGKAFCSLHQSAAVKGLSVSLMSFRIRSCFLSCVDTVTLTAASPRKLFTCCRLRSHRYTLFFICSLQHFFGVFGFIELQLNLCLLLWCLVLCLWTSGADSRWRRKFRNGQCLGQSCLNWRFAAESEVLVVKSCISPGFYFRLTGRGCCLNQSEESQSSTFNALQDVKPAWLNRQSGLMKDAKKFCDFGQKQDKSNFCCAREVFTTPTCSAAWYRVMSSTQADQSNRMYASFNV